MNVTAAPEAARTATARPRRSLADVTTKPTGLAGRVLTEGQAKRLAVSAFNSSI